MNDTEKTDKITQQKEGQTLQVTKYKVFYINVKETAFEVIAPSEKDAIADLKTLLVEYRRAKGDKWDKCIANIDKGLYMVIEIDRPLIREILN